MSNEVGPLRVRRREILFSSSPSLSLPPQSHKEGEKRKTKEFPFFNYYLCSRDVNGEKGTVGCDATEIFSFM